MPLVFNLQADILKLFKSEVVGGTLYSDVLNGGFSVITPNLQCSIQSMKSDEISDFEARNIKVAFKVYSKTNPMATLGNLVRFQQYPGAPTQYLVVRWMEVLAGRNKVFGLFTDLVV